MTSQEPAGPPFAPPPTGIPVWMFAMSLLLVPVAIFGGYLVGRGPYGDLPEPQATALRLVHKQILASHVEPHQAGELLDRALAGMVDGLDPYSRYIPPAKVQAYDEDTTGSYEGIGAAVGTSGGTTYIRFPFAGGPAERGGLLPGDRLLAVDGVELQQLTAAERQDLHTRLRGKAGTKVALRVQRAGREPFVVEVERGAVQKASVKWARLVDPAQRLGYLWIADFQNETSAEVGTALQQLADDAGGQLGGLVLDLRWDGGGQLDECLDVVRKFVANGTLLSTRRRDAELARYEAEPKKCTHPDLPLVVLVNGSTASASEVVTGALQDLGRAAVVGERTYGKGYVNTIFAWRNLDFRLKLTTAWYFTPKGRNIEGHDKNAKEKKPGGLQPDREVPLAEAVAQAVLRRLLDHEPPRRYREAVQQLDAGLGDGDRAPLGPEADPQLAAALEALRQRLPGAAAGK